MGWGSGDEAQGMVGCGGLVVVVWWQWPSGWELVTVFFFLLQFSGHREVQKKAANENFVGQYVLAANILAPKNKVISLFAKSDRQI